MSENDAFSLVRNCTAPWKSLDSCSRRPSTYDPYIDHIDGIELRMQCFNCEKDECDNCHSSRYSKIRKTRMKEARKIFVGYYIAGYDMKAICEAMQISRTTYLRYLERFINTER